MIKGNVPIFNEQIDLSDPSGTAKSFVGMALGVSIALAAYRIGETVYNEAAERTPARELEVF